MRCRQWGRRRGCLLSQKQDSETGVQGHLLGTGPPSGTGGKVGSEGKGSHCTGKCGTSNACGWLEVNPTGSGESRGNALLRTTPSGGMRAPEYFSLNSQQSLVDRWPEGGQYEFSGASGPLCRQHQWEGSLWTKKRASSTVESGRMWGQGQGRDHIHCPRRSVWACGTPQQGFTVCPFFFPPQGV